MVLKLTRAYLPTGTFGKLELSPEDWACYTVERPWKNNSPNISCIPEGVYRIFRSEYHRGGYPCFEVEGVAYRSLIKIHKANWPTDVEGCIGVGREITALKKSGDIAFAVSGSAITFSDFMGRMSGIDEAELRIASGYVT
jgi:hypothetical protein